MIFVRVKDVEAAEDELVLFGDEAVQEVDVVLVLEVVLGQAVDELEELLLVLRDGRHGSVEAHHDLLSKAVELGAEGLLVDGVRHEVVDQPEDFTIFFQNEIFELVGGILFEKALVLEMEDHLQVAVLVWLAGALLHVVGSEHGLFAKLGRVHLLHPVEAPMSTCHGSIPDLWLLLIAASTHGLTEPRQVVSAPIEASSCHGRGPVFSRPI